MAALLFDRSLSDEPELVDAVAAAPASRCRNGRLQAELRARLEEFAWVPGGGARSRPTGTATAGTKPARRCPAAVGGPVPELGLLGERSDTDPETRARLARAKAEVAASLAELRDVARGIYPAVLTNHGLAVALESLAGAAAVPVQLDVDLPGRLPEPVEVPRTTW
jgi:hypothetical protein